MSFLADAAQNYIRYSDGLEEIDPSESETFEKINKLMSEGADTVREKYHSLSESPARKRMVL